jgi:NADPH:quinone reductase-like Zn-dependent oxidoreductase
MKAVQIHEYGAAGVLRYGDVADPVVNDDDVLIRVIGTSVNHPHELSESGRAKGKIALYVGQP